MSPGSTPASRPESTPASTLGPHSVGERVVVRHVLRGRTAPSGRPLLTDVLGVLEEWGASTLTVLEQVIPGEVRKAPGDQLARDQWSWFCGGSSAIIGWSWSISPILAAPPGEPRSSKKWTLAS